MAFFFTVSPFSFLPISKHNNSCVISVRNYCWFNGGIKSSQIGQLSKIHVSIERDLITKKDDSAEKSIDKDYGVVSIHHVGILCENLERSLAFYKDLLGLEVNVERPDEKLPYRGAWLWVGAEMIHLMELPNPDPCTGRPPHGGRDRHTCMAIRDVGKLKGIFDRAGISYTLSKSGRPAIFTRDPDGNALEFTQV